MVAHKSIDQIEVTEVSAFDGETTLVDLVDELHSPLYILFDRILRNQHSVFYLLVIEEGLLEVGVSLTPLLLHFQPHSSHPEIPLRKELQHVLVTVNDAEDLRNPPQPSKCKEHTLTDIAAYVDNQRRVKFLNSPSGLLDEFVVYLLLIKDEVNLAQGGYLEPVFIFSEAVELLTDAYLFLMQLGEFRLVSVDNLVGIAQPHRLQVHRLHLGQVEELLIFIVGVEFHFLGAR